LNRNVNNMQKIFIFIALVVVTSVTHITAQTTSILKSAPLSEASPESVGIFSERLARIDQMCQEEVENGNLKIMHVTSGLGVKLKAAGGVRTLVGLLAVTEAGCSRCGSTTTIAILEEAKKRFAN